MSEFINKYSLSIIINDQDSDITIPSPSMSTTSTSSLSSPSPSPPPPRKGSIASMLNSIDELEQLDHEEWLTNYQTHFQTNKPFTNMEIKTRDIKQQQLNNNNNSIYNNNNNNSNSNKKGLRLFSQHICDIIQHYGKINYHQLVQKLCDTKDIYLSTKTTCHKNIKRRVYDALNVLMAIGVIRKENKYIYWKGYPFNINTTHDDTNDDYLLKEIQNEQQRYHSLKSRILEKQYQIQQIIYQHNTFSLMQQ